MPKKNFTGIIVSDKMNKTVVVRVETPKIHPIYKKIIRNSKRFMARNEIEAKLNDKVIIEESRPFSKRVSWKVVKNLSSEIK